MRQIKNKELNKLRNHFHKKQNCVCPILKIKSDYKDMVVDHSHIKNARHLKSNDGTLIRGVIHRQANTMEGKISNSFIRCGLHKFNITLPNFLRNLADFIENPPLIKLKYVHPSEKKKDPILMVRNFNKLSLAYSKKYPNRKPLKYNYYIKKKTNVKKPRQKLTITLKKLYSEFNIKPEFFKN